MRVHAWHKAEYCVSREVSMLHHTPGAPTQDQVDFAWSTCSLNRAGQHGEWHTCPHCYWWSRLQLLLHYAELLPLKP